jgi:crotonobetainyl-CoA:carnitine CoA-transferase CaiB-like acyl-CoA transferase
MEELIDDPKFKTIPDRVKNKDELREVLEKALIRKNTEEWIEILNNEGIACGPIYTIDQVFRDKHILHREMLLEIDHPISGKIKQIGFPVKMSRTPCKISLAPPYFSQNTDEILKELDYSEGEIKELKERGII